MQAIKQKNWNPMHNVYKSDVFTLGMIILECIIMKNCNEAYDVNKKVINIDAIQHYLLFMDGKYS